MAFHDIRFPLDISMDAQGGPHRRTDIITLASGREARNSPWRYSRRRFEAGYGVKSLADIEAIIAFFEARQGRLHSFRWRDPFDWKSGSVVAMVSPLDQAIGVGDGVQRNFPIIKSYLSGGQSYQRPIRHVIPETLVIAIDGTSLEMTDFQLDPTGAVEIFAPPASGAQITAGYEFDIEVRFETDQLNISMASFQAGDIPLIPIIEVMS